jgi:hypothetical protein
MSVLAKTQYEDRDIRVLRGVTIREYDMVEAGWSVVKALSLAPEAHVRLSVLPKHERNVVIGRLEGEDPALSRALQNGLRQARLDFGEANGIEDHRILAVRRDAIFVIGEPCRTTTVGNYVWKQKSRYSSFYRLNKVEFLYSAWSDTLDIKGLGDEIREVHGPWMLDQLKRVIRSSERSSPKDLLRLLRKWRSDYVTRVLPVQHYREMSRGNSYRTTMTSGGKPVFLSDVDDTVRGEIDITYNYAAYLAPLIGLMV